MSFLFDIRRWGTATEIEYWEKMKTTKNKNKMIEYIVVNTIVDCASDDFENLYFIDFSLLIFSTDELKIIENPVLVYPFSRAFFVCRHTIETCRDADAAVVAVENG